MNKNILQKELENQKIPKDMYSLDGGVSNDTLCLNETNGHWEVYYSERGQKYRLKTYDTESEACEYLYHQVIKAVESRRLYSRNPPSI